MSTPRLQDVLNQIVTATVNALNAAGVSTPAQVGIGYPVSTELVKILNSQQYQVTLIDRPGTTRSSARYPSHELIDIGNPVSTLTATIAPPATIAGSWSIVFGGSAGAGAAVTVIVGACLSVFTYIATPNESLATTMANVAAGINALAIPGVVATVVDSLISITKTPLCIVNVCGSGYVVAREVNRLTCSVQMTINCPNPTLRYQVRDAIESAVGTIDSPFLTLSDGTKAFCALIGGAGTGTDDDSQSSYSLYLDHLVFEVEYGVLQTYQAYPIEVVEATLTTPSGASATAISGGNP